MTTTFRDVIIEPATALVADELSALLGELGYPATAEEVGRRLARLGPTLDPASRDAVFCARDGTSARVLGMLALHRFSALHDDADVALITALVVAQAARGSGVGRQLVDRALDTARAWGCKRVIVTTHVRRADAHAFYERIGFELTGRRYAKAL